MTDRITLTLQTRDTLGKKVKNLRRAGIVPVHLYGSGTDSRSLQCQRQELIKVLTRAGGNTPISITVDGETDEHLAFAREIQWDPIGGGLFHVDFFRTEATQVVSVEVPVVLVGDSPGAREASGTVVQQIRSVTVEALPLDMPQGITADLATLTDPHGVIRAGEISLPPGATLVTAADEVVVRIQVARVDVVEEAPIGEDETEAEGQQEEQESP